MTTRTDSTETLPSGRQRGVGLTCPRGAEEKSSDERELATSAHRALNESDERTAILPVFPVPATPRGLPGRYSGATEECRIVRPAGEAAGKGIDVAGLIDQRPIAQIFCERTLARCIGDCDCQASQWIGQRLVRQAHRPAHRFGAFKRQANVM